MSTEAPSQGQAGAAGSVWAPLLRPVFRALWLAQFAANIGVWAQTVGAQWLMGDLGAGPLAVSAVQSALSFPVFVLVVPSGAVADMFSRRFVMLVSRTLMATAALLLAVLTALNRLTNLPLMAPWLLLTLIAMVGTGQAVGMAASDAILRELVPLDQISHAAVLDGISFNVARAAGPALGGALIAVIGPSATFALNAVAFSAVLAVLFSWSPPRQENSLGTERFRAALRAGLRYVAGARLFTRLLGRLMLFMIFAAALWGLIPNVARDQLDLGADGYGILLGCLGLGAAVGAIFLPMLRRRIPTDLVITIATALYAGALVVIGYVTWLPAVVVALGFAGFAWIANQSTFIATAQLLLPDWTRARSLAYFHLVLMGGQAFGTFLWGLIAQHTSLSLAFGLPAGGLIVFGWIGWFVFRLPSEPPDVQQAQSLPTPPETDQDPEAGPVLVFVEWWVMPSRAEEFVEAMRQVGSARRRTGARIWGLFQSMENRYLFTESFTVSTWGEYLRQLQERNVEPDLRAWTEAESYTLPGTTTRTYHFIAQAVARTPRPRLSAGQLSRPTTESTDPGTDPDAVERPL